MNRVELLLRTPDVALVGFDHPPAAEHADPEHEVATHDGISFVEAGSFGVETDGRHWTFGPGMLFVTTRGMRFSCSHECGTPTDRCLSVTFAERAVEDLLAAGVPALQPPAARVSARQHYLRHRLRHSGPGQEMRLELLAGALYESLGDAGRARSRRSEGQLGHVTRCVDRAVDLIETDFGRALTLRELASAAGLSAYHFARVFGELTGLPPHRYLTAVRLRYAAALLHQGASVSSTCLEAGFGSLSHFVTAFRKRFGIVPSEARGGARYAALRSSLRAPIWPRRRH